MTMPNIGDKFWWNGTAREVEIIDIEVLDGENIYSLQLGEVPFSLLSEEELFTWCSKTEEEALEKAIKTQKKRIGQIKKDFTEACYASDQRISLLEGRLRAIKGEEK